MDETSLKTGGGPHGHLFARNELARRQLAAWFCPCGRGHPFSSESNGSARTPSDAHIAAECWDLAVAALKAPPVLVTLALYLGDLDIADLRALRALGKGDEETRWQRQRLVATLRRVSS